jgi:hypothetical protein
LAGNTRALYQREDFFDMKRLRISLFALAAAASFAPAAQAQTEIEWWHAFTGRLGELLDAQVAAFNESQSDYRVVASHKGNYSEALNAGIAAFRAGRAAPYPEVFEVGTATMMAARGAIKPVYEVMSDSGLPTFDPQAYIPSVTGYYTDTEGNMLSLPYNASTPVMYVNRDIARGGGHRSRCGPLHLGARWARARPAEGSGLELSLHHRLAVLGPPGESRGLARPALRHQGERLRRTRHGAGVQRSAAGQRTSSSWATGPRKASSSIPAAATRAAPGSVPASAPCSPKARPAMPA